MANAYMPRDQRGALVWMKTFAGGIAADPGRYGLSAPDAATIQQAVARFDAAMTLAQDESTRTRVTVAGKDDARRAAELVCQQYYSLIKPNGGVSDADKIAIGVRPLNRGRSPITCPASAPLLSIIGATPACHTLRYRDTLTPTRSGKPFGAIALQLFVTVGEHRAAADPDRARFCGSFTRNPVGVSFPHAEEGRIATYHARWTSRRGAVGPWSAPVAMRIAA